MWKEVALLYAPTWENFGPLEVKNFSLCLFTTRNLIIFFFSQFAGYDGESNLSTVCFYFKYKFYLSILFKRFIDFKSHHCLFYLGWSMGSKNRHMELCLCNDFAWWWSWCWRYSNFIIIIKNKHNFCFFHCVHPIWMAHKILFVI